MDLNQILALASRWLHIIPVIVLVGGTIFLRLSVVGASDLESYSDFREEMRKRWAKWIGISILFILVTGLYNAVTKIMAYELSSVYHTLVMVKLGLGFFVFFLASLLSGRSARAQKLRENETYWLNILCICMLILVMVAGYMKSLATDAPKKVREAETAQVTAQSRTTIFNGKAADASTTKAVAVF